MDTATQIKAETEREGLLAVYKELRTKHGFIAKANYGCCGSCVAYELGELADNPTKMSKNKKYWTFWTVQDEDSFDGRGFLREGFGIYLDYGSMKKDEGDEDTIEAGNIMVEVLKQHGFDVEWNGDPRKAILVKGWVTLPADLKRIRNKVRWR